MKERISYQDIPKGLTDGFLKNEMYLKKSTLDPKLLELMRYRVSQINGCAWCLDMHHKEAIHMGESELRLHTLSAWRECPYYSDQERAVFRFAEDLTLASSREIDDEQFESLEKLFTKDEIAMLTLAVAQINAWNRINKSFRPIPGNYQVSAYEHQNN